ncbi:gamma-glutamyl-gamma-aminobutyrate hydrolase [Campylobacter sp. MIT 12-8780]|uniref:gamma-glutamyl-CDP-amidate hydrolase n=1 Tax=unclassified Campylobacter TaxID=2593542 RepID=UPI00115D9C8B|nr:MULTISPECIES: gamma-glutamyl-CDP-amidate hydrolase [unclassified Campylobacter]NDJ27831.1 gamma-glutamyl-gamma-aminobutyrate hydrolase family protein [Campylobacter sp. MIT 19-121]TQR40966.1 gamma-glutamyl-gamma-aminobutyrate hydrolase [Campylobacter sp. MIT 12-8780]
MSLKFIGITQRLVQNESYFELREALSLEWGVFFNTHLKGFLPLPLSYELDFALYEPFLAGVILSGGNDLSVFNENELCKRRDIYENKLLKTCMLKNKPVLGICRGAQLIAHFFGSNLKQCQDHVGKHEVKDMQEKLSFEVNSFHNFSISHLGQDLEALFKADDESIEAFKHKKLDIYATMWHIERAGGLENMQVLDEFKKSLNKA